MLRYSIMSQRKEGKKEGVEKEKYKKNKDMINIRRMSDFRKKQNPKKKRKERVQTFSFDNEKKVGRVK